MRSKKINNNRTLIFFSLNFYLLVYYFDSCIVANVKMV